ncbi:hypothetical protein LOTGIDRAFT_175299 [Lottia gigantea]|uniref:Uncharacterized protein n=1 Tax=Lottia gigantea TaxID=225164 RepID=V3ZTX4_LOTGI|nr:hypothetical protein LOTGIDRAFT_175299 [Lottia gigantea]ESO94908.1 hypothetical protein LOTGIDRAFT_175299 [Lottia gigantea]
MTAENLSSKTCGKVFPSKKTFWSAFDSGNQVSSIAQLRFFVNRIFKGRHSNNEHQINVQQTYIGKQQQGHIQKTKPNLTLSCGVKGTLGEIPQGGHRPCPAEMESGHPGLCYCTAGRLAQVCQSRMVC